MNERAVCTYKTHVKIKLARPGQGILTASTSEAQALVGQTTRLLTPGLLEQGRARRRWRWCWANYPDVPTSSSRTHWGRELGDYPADCFDGTVDAVLIPLVIHTVGFPWPSWNSCILLRWLSLWPESAHLSQWKRRWYLGSLAHFSCSLTSPIATEHHGPPPVPKLAVMASQCLQHTHHMTSPPLPPSPRLILLLRHPRTTVFSLPLHSRSLRRGHRQSELRPVADVVLQRMGPVAARLENLGRPPQSEMTGCGVPVFGWAHRVCVDLPEGSKLGLFERYRWS